MLAMATALMHQDSCLTDAVSVYPKGETGIRQYERLQIGGFGTFLF